MSDTAPLVTAAEISRLAGVTRATVSNWRRRHPGFPGPAGGSESRPLFDLHQVQRWLSEHGVAAAESPLQHLRTVLRSEVPPQDIPELMELLPKFAETRGVATAPGNAGGKLADAVRAAVDDSGPVATLDVLAERGLEESPTTGVYQTPHPVAALMVDLVAAAAGIGSRDVLDPACGSGTLLTEAARTGVREYYGQDVLSVQARRTAVLLRVAGHSFDVRTGDSLSADAFPGLEVDAVLCNPPYSQRDWGAEELALDPRWEYGVPPRGESEMAWVQHALGHLRPGGIAALLLPPAVAVRSSGRRIRAALLRAGALRAVIALPTGVATPRHIGLQLWVLRRPETTGPIPDQVLFIDAARLPKAQGDRPEWDAVSKTVVDAWRAFDHGSPDSATVPDVAAAVRVMEVLDEDVDLTPARYVRAPVDLERVPGEVNDSIRDLADEMSGLVRAVESVGSWSAASGKPWRTATIADLAAGGALQLITAAPVQDADHFEMSADDAARPVLTARDIVTGGRPSGAVGTDAPPLSAIIFEGDVLMPRIRSDRDGRGAARVASAEDDGAWLGEHVFLFRPDPERLDPWFLAGFAGSAENASAMLGTTMIRLAPQRIRIPLLPLAEQRRYGDAFRRLHDLRIAARRAGDSAARVAGLVTGGLTAGALEPHNTNTASSPEPAEPKLRRGRK